MMDVTTLEMMVARERRAARRREFGQTGFPVIACTLNLAGPRKRSSLSDLYFNYQLSDLRQRIRAAGGKIEVEEQSMEKTGCEYAAAVSGLSAAKLKRVAVDLEMLDAAGRMLDCDVSDKNGQAVAREALGLPERVCLICDQPAFVCARNRTHSVTRLWRKAHLLIARSLTEILERKICEGAVRALLYEVATSPKPGLVDRFNQGSHPDMDFFLYIDSSLALQSYWRDCWKLAGEIAWPNMKADPIEGRVNNPQPETRDDLVVSRLFAQARQRGLMAEQAMFRATAGVNTQKGLIFAFGLITTAYGYLWHRAMHSSVDNPQEKIFPKLSQVSDLVSQMGKLSLADFQFTQTADHTECRTAQNLTAGEKFFHEVKHGGARVEAANGYQIALRALKEQLLPRLNEGASVNDASLGAWLFLAAEVEDTNLFKRAGAERFAAYQAELKKALREIEDHAELVRYLNKLDRRCIALGDTFGGTADLLAVTWYWHILDGLAADFSGMGQRA